MDPYGYNQQPVRRGGGIKLLPILLFAGYLAYYYFSNQQTVPMTGRKQLVDISREQEMALGFQSFRQVLQQERVATGPNADAIKEIGRKLVSVSDDKNYQWEFVLLESDDVNAFALPGGKVAYYTGLLRVTNTPDQVAAVMGHEIGHVIARHGAERMSHQKLVQFGTMAAGMAMGDMDSTTQRTVMGAIGLGSQFGILLPFSRDHENEADHIGLILAARACFDPRQAPLLWQKMSQQGGQKPAEFMSTHPSDSTRIRKLNELMPEALAEREKYCAGR
jgi:predicted Zn-dependent protease